MTPLLATHPNRRAILSVALLGGLLLGLAGAALVARLSQAQESARLEDLKLDLRDIAARVRTRGPGLVRAERTLAADPFLPGATPTLAANGLQRRVVALAEASGVRLRTIGAEAVTAVEGDALPHVTLQAAASARVAALQKLLYRLETETPFVLVDEVAIRAPQAAAGDGLRPVLDPELDVDLRLIGFLHRKEG